MQTFLPARTFRSSVACLDNARLNKQRSECKQLLNAIFKTGRCYPPSTPNHPCAVQWEDYTLALGVYSVCVCNEWVRRGYEDNVLPDILFFVPDADLYKDWEDLPPEEVPWWLTEPLMMNHRARLLDKNPTHYKRYRWNVAPQEYNLWPVNRAGETWTRKLVVSKENQSPES